MRGICSVDGCDRPHNALGYCPMHYQRFLRGGVDNLGGPELRLDRLAWNAPAAERFEYKVNRHGPVATNHPELGRCWTWTGRKCKGYGALQVNKRTTMAHRWAYEHWRGPIPRGLDLDHFACDNRACCNPWHLRAVTRGENTARGTSERPGNASRTRCIAGHAFDAANTYIDPAGKRYCRICRRRREAESEQRRRLRVARNQQRSAS